MTDLAATVAAARAEFDACTDAAALENAKARYLGKAGALTELLKGLAKLSAAERPAAGAAIHVEKKGRRFAPPSLFAASLRPERLWPAPRSW